MNVLLTSRTRAAVEGTTTALLLRNTCSHAGQNSTTSPSFIPNGDETRVKTTKRSHRGSNEKRHEMDFIVTSPE